MFGSDDDNAEYLINFDSGGWEKITGIQFNMDQKDILDGHHIVKVVARDNTGRTSNHPAVCTWVQDTQPPTVSFMFVPASVSPEVNTAIMAVSDTASDTFSYNLDSAGKYIGDSVIFISRYALNMQLDLLLNKYH